MYIPDDKLAADSATESVTAHQQLSQLIPDCYAVFEVKACCVKIWEILRLSKLCAGKKL